MEHSPEAVANPGPKRTTSSAQQPHPAIALPERVLKKQNKLQDATLLGGMRDKTWTASLRRLRTCSDADYDLGKGLKSVWSLEDAEPKQECILFCEGDVQSLQISVAKKTGYQQPMSERSEFLRVDIPSEPPVDMRWYPATRTLELRVSAGTSEKTVWELDLRDDVTKHIDYLKESKAAWKRLEGITGKMPNAWFAHRNFASVQTSTSTSSNEFVQEFSGGFEWKFTGLLASDEFQKAIGNIPNEPKPKAAASANAHSGVKTRQAAKKEEKQARRAAKLAGRASQGDLSHSSVANAAVDDLESQPGEATEEEQAEENDSQQPWDVDALLDCQEFDGVLKYLVKWSGPFKPSWEPSNNVSKTAVEKYHHAQFAKQHGITLETSSESEE